MYRILIIGMEGYLERLLAMFNYENVSVAGIVTLDTPRSNQAIGKYNLQAPVYRYDQLKEVVAEHCYEYIFVATLNNNEAVDSLKKYGADKQKIIDMSAFYNRNMESLVNLLKNYLHSLPSCTAFITGNSYAYHGSDMNVYGDGVLNLSSTSQDLFYDYELVKIALSKQPSSFTHAIIGLAPYSFHSDLSLSALGWCAFTYYPLCRTMHNYRLSTEAAEQIFNDSYTGMFDTAAVEMQFRRHDRLGYFTNDGMTITTAMRARERAEMWAGKYFPQTFKENIAILRQYLDTCHKQQIRPILVVYPVTDFYYKWFNKRILDEFYFTINELAKEFKFEFYDFWRDTRFTYEDFFDVDHLNAKGAAKISAIIKGMI